MQTGIKFYLRLHKAHAVDSGEHDAVGAVGGDNFLRDVVVVLYAERVELRVANLLDLVVEESVEVAVVLVDVEGCVLVLSLRLGNEE